MRWYAILVGLLCTWSSAVVGQTLDFNLSNDTAAVEISRDMGKQGFGRSQGALGALYTEDDDIMGLAELRVVGPAGSESPGLDVGVGVRAYGVGMDDADAAALGLGGQLRYAPPQMERVRLRLHTHYAPNIVSFLDADRFWELNVRAGYEVLPEAVVYVGYRKIRIGLEDRRDTDLDNSGYFGIEFKF